jgi:hypothetical protein
MINNSILVCYSTPNYKPLSDLFIESAFSVGFSKNNIYHNYDETYKTNETGYGQPREPEQNREPEGFQSKLWYYCISQKIKHLINILRNVLSERTNVSSYYINTPKYLIFSDCDVIFIEKNKEQWKNIETHINSTPNNMFFMREKDTEQINTGFFIIKLENIEIISEVLQYFVFVYEKLCKTPNAQMPLGDQSVINETIRSFVKSIKYDYIPNKYAIWGEHVWDIENALFHHAVCCSNITEKFAQFKMVKSLFIEKTENIDIFFQGSLETIKNVVYQKFIKIVVSRFNEDIEWTNQFNNVIIYNKGEPVDNSDIISQTIHPIKNLVNMGREGHTIYNYIYENYGVLDEYIIFLQGNPFDHSPNLIENIKNIENLILVKSSLANHHNPISFQYLSETCANSNFINEINLHWKCRNIHNTYIQIFKPGQNINEIENIPFHFCEGSQFIVSKSTILKRPIEFYKNIVDMLDKECDPLCGYDIERFHQLIFA